MNVRHYLGGAVLLLSSGIAGCVGEESSGLPADDGNAQAATTAATGGGEGDGGGDAIGPPQTLASALDDFGSCMSIEVFVETGVYKLFKNLAIVGNQEQACGSCHASGEGGAVISEDVEAAFIGSSTFPGVMRFVTGTVDEQGNFKDLVPSNRFIDKGADECYPGELCHPPYDLPTDMQRAILTFTEESLARWEAGECDAPYSPDQPQE